MIHNLVNGIVGSIYSTFFLKNIDVRIRKFQILQYFSHRGETKDYDLENIRIDNLETKFSDVKQKIMI